MSTEHDLLTLCLRLCMEPTSSHSPETLAVLERWRPAWEAAAGGMPFEEAIRLASPPLPEGMVLVSRDFLERCKHSHYSCEDNWYSCPQAEDGCLDERRGPECDCGAKEWNAEIDAMLAAAKEGGK